MKVTYDQEVDTLRIILNDEDIEESDEDKPGVIIDEDKQGSIVGLEVNAYRQSEGAGLYGHGIAWGVSVQTSCENS